MVKNRVIRDPTVHYKRLKKQYQLSLYLLLVFLIHAFGAASNIWFVDSGATAIFSFTGDSVLRGSAYNDLCSLDCTANIPKAAACDVHSDS